MSEQEVIKKEEKKIKEKVWCPLLNNFCFEKLCAWYSNEQCVIRNLDFLYIIADAGAVKPRNYAKMFGGEQ